MEINFEQGYNMLRGENYRIQKELDYYRSGLAESDAFRKLKQTDDKKIHSLEWALDLAKKRDKKNRQTIKDQQAEINHARERYEKKYREYEEAYDKYQREIEDMQKEVEKLKGIISKLSAQINRDYTNSSIPSSRDPNHRKIANSRESSGLKPGAQAGHKASHRTRMTPTEQIIELIPREVVEHPEDWEATKQIRSRQVLDIQFSVSCTQYIARGFKNRKNHHILYSAFPSNVVNEVNYGKGIKALCCILTSYCNVSIRKTSSLLKELTGDQIHISVGTIAGLPGDLSSRTAEDRLQLRRNMMSAPFMNHDATAVRINGVNWNIYVSAAGGNAIYSLCRHKGIEGIKATPAADYLNTLIHDHDSSYYNEEFQFHHQECLAHLIRYCQDSIDNEPHLTWNIQMKEHLQSIIHQYKSGEMNAEEIEAAVCRYYRILQTAEYEYEQNPPTKYYRDGFALAKRLRAYAEETLNFLTSEDNLPYTNNLSERLLRACKMKYHAACTFRSEESVLAYCNIMSLIETAVMRDESIYQMMLEGFSR